MTFPLGHPFVLAAQVIGEGTVGEIADVVQILTFVGVIALGAALWYLRQIFATREEVEASFGALRKEHEEKVNAVREQRLEDIERYAQGMKDLREEFHSIYGRMETAGAQRHDALTSDIDDLKHDIRRSLARADGASDQASVAVRTAESAAMEIKHLSERVSDALQPLRDLRDLPTQVARIEERLGILTAGMPDRRSGGLSREKEK